MKKLLALFGVAALCTAAWYCAYAGTQILVGSLSTVNNTTYYTAAYNIGNAFVPSGTFLFSDGGTTATNALSITIQVSFDQTNFTSVGTWYPPVTNAGTWPYTPFPTNMPIYMRGVVTTTNSVQVGGSFTQ